ncbi:MAG: aminotransferase class I/II-fold pyridoxal phosphate-dependent enzyme [Mycobacteriales bacterium]
MSDVLRGSLRGFGTSIFSTVTEQAIAAGAINLSQGFPDFEPPERLVEAAVEAVAGGLHQYAPSIGDPVLRQAVAEHQQARYGLAADPDTEVTVTAGASEAITATLLALLEPGDEVVLVEPYYDLYPYAVVAAGGVPRYLTTSFPDFRLDLDRLAALVTDRTRVILVNTPTNPTGRLLGPEETRALGELAERHHAYILSDEVYEHIVFDGRRHRPVAADPACRDRTITVSSVSKTFSATGWRIGWAVAPPALSAAVRSMHQFVTFTASTPLQRASAVMLESAATGDYYDQLVADYTERRDLLLKDLRRTELEVASPDGTYFAMTRCAGDDMAYVRDLIARRRVAAIPASAFFSDPARGRGLVRFAFCKRLETLRAAGERL